MTAVGALTVLAAEALAGTASVVGAMSVEALWEPTSRSRPHTTPRVRIPVRGASPPSFATSFADSGLQHSHHGEAHKVQDPYSIRCIPQVHGAARDALGYARGVLEIEINSSTDNPLVFPDGTDADPDAVATGGGRVISGGNFHGEPVALALDFAALAIAELGSISERRTALLIDGRLSGLPPFLAEDAGLNSGMMLLQYTAAALVSENKSLVHPASADSIPDERQPGRPCVHGLDLGSARS